MDLFEKTVRSIRPVKGEWYDTAQKHLDNLTKPPGSLGGSKNLPAGSWRSRKTPDRSSTKR